MKTRDKINKRIPQLRFPEFSGEWEEKRLGEIAHIYDGTHQTPAYVDEGVPFYSVENVTADDFKNTKFISQEVFEKEKIRVEKNDILMTRIGDIGTSKLINWEAKASFYVSLALIRLKENIIPDFGVYVIESTPFQRELWKRTIHVAFPKKINLGEIGQCKLSLPPSTGEQQKIANLLSTIDNWIENLKKQKEKWEEYKKGLIQQLFPAKGESTPRLRFPEFSGEWEEKRLGEILTERKEYTTQNSGYPHVSLTIDGVVPKTDRYNRNFLVKDSKNKKYKITKQGDLCYNPANLKFGVISLNKLGDGIFSPIYITFQISDAYVDFVGYYLTRKSFVNFARRYEQGTVYERMAVYPRDFLQIRLPFPSLPEQHKIADFLSKIDQVIESKQKQIDRAEAWKKGLMQRMFI